MPLSLAQVYDICLATDPDGKCCRYLSQDSNGNDYHCLKKSQFKKEIETSLLKAKHMLYSHKMVHSRLIPSVLDQREPQSHHTHLASGL
jgi:hypothetical protein